MNALRVSLRLGALGYIFVLCIERLSHEIHSAAVRALPTYSMQMMRLSSGVINYIGQVFRKFIWCGATGPKKIHLANGRRLCQPKFCGGLGLKNLRTMNNALLMKLDWGILSSPTSFWVQVLRSKYGFYPSSFDSNLPTRYGSYLWKALGQVWHMVVDGIRWTIGNG